MKTLPELPRELWVRIFFYSKILHEISMRKQLLHSAEFAYQFSCSAFSDVPIFMFHLNTHHTIPFHTNYPLEACQILINGKYHRFLIGLWNEPNKLVYLVPESYVLCEKLSETSIKIERILVENEWFDCMSFIH